MTASAACGQPCTRLARRYAKKKNLLRLLPPGMFSGRQHRTRQTGMPATISGASVHLRRSASLEGYSPVTPMSTGVLFSSQRLYSVALGIRVPWLLPWLDLLAGGGTFTAPFCLCSCTVVARHGSSLFPTRSSRAAAEYCLSLSACLLPAFFACHNTA